MGSLCSADMGDQHGVIRTVSFNTLYDTIIPEYAVTQLHIQQLKALGTWPVFEVWDHFNKGKILGKGGYGEVVVVTMKELDEMEIPIEFKEIPNTHQEYAMKILNKTRKDKDSFPSFENEVRIDALCKNPHIVEYVASFVSSDHYHIVTELCHGGEVFDRIVSHKRFSERVASNIVQQMLVGLEHCHKKNIVHRDLKPSNFVFQNNDDILTKNCIVKLIDFGLAKIVDPEKVYKEKVGTPFYVSPETINPHHPLYKNRTGDILKSADMWSMGAIVFVLVTGKLPFPGKKHKEIFRNVIKCRFKFPSQLLLSDSVKHFINSLLQLDPLQRMTCSEALKHPWILNREKNAPERPLDNQVLQGLGMFQRANKLQKAVARLAVNFLTDADKAMLQDIFATYDKDRSGKLEIEEIVNLLKDSGFNDMDAELEAQNIMDDLDVNSNGALTMAEFAQVAARPRLSMHKTIARRTFASIDLDGDGSITAMEMKESLGIDDDYIERIFRKADADKDGLLTFDEFLQAMTMTMTVRTKRKTQRGAKKKRGSVFDVDFSQQKKAPNRMAHNKYKLEEQKEG